MINGHSQNLASRMRPVSLEEFVGQGHLLENGRVLSTIIKRGKLSSIILWGPPGSGKTTLACILANSFQADFHQLSAVSMGKKELIAIVAMAQEAKKSEKTTILFIDEIHRWNKAQQDALLPYVESSLITLIGATTENPSFEVIGPLLSRCRVLQLKKLEDQELKKILNRVLQDTERGLGKLKVSLEEDAQKALLLLSGGDSRVMLNALELLADHAAHITKDMVQEVFQRKAGLYDKKGDEHYNIASAFIKSMRGSDPDAALYYLMRMLEGGEDPLFLARRMVIFASEDIGLRDRAALTQASSAFQAVHAVGMPEAKLILGHMAILLSVLPKSRAVVNAVERAQEALQEHLNEPVPLHVRNAPTKLMKDMGYAKGYEWSDGYVGPKNKNQSFLPKALEGSIFFKKEEVAPPQPKQNP
ncbi:MAG: replication-associated recombination protein A [bacterium]|nr:replication-associated recombination protein A [bacterium]